MSTNLTFPSYSYLGDGSNPPPLDSLARHASISIISVCLLALFLQPLLMYCIYVSTKINTTLKFLFFTQSSYELISIVHAIVQEILNEYFGYYYGGKTACSTNGIQLHYTTGCAVVTYAFISWERKEKIINNRAIPLPKSILIVCGYSLLSLIISLFPLMSSSLGKMVLHEGKILCYGEYSFSIFILVTTIALALALNFTVYNYIAIVRTIWGNKERMDKIRGGGMKKGGIAGEITAGGGNTEQKGEGEGDGDAIGFKKDQLKLAKSDGNQNMGEIIIMNNKTTDPGHLPLTSPSPPPLPSFPLHHHSTDLIADHNNNPDDDHISGAVNLTVSVDPISPKVHDNHSNPPPSPSPSLSPPPSPSPYPVDHSTTDARANNHFRDTILLAPSPSPPLSLYPQSPLSPHSSSSPSHSVLPSSSHSSPSSSTHFIAKLSLAEETRLTIMMLASTLLYVGIWSIVGMTFFVGLFNVVEMNDKIDYAATISAYCTCVTEPMLFFAMNRQSRRDIRRLGRRLWMGIMGIMGMRGKDKEGEGAGGGGGRVFPMDGGSVNTDNDDGDDNVRNVEEKGDDVVSKKSKSGKGVSKKGKKVLTHKFTNENEMENQNIPKDEEIKDLPLSPMVADNAHDDVHPME